MTSLLILNGPNLNMLGRREPELYGSETLSDIEQACRKRAASYGLEIDFRQSNHEGELVTWIQEAVTAKAPQTRSQAAGYVGVIINAAAYTHSSIALHDALKMLDIPVIEVHLTDPKSRERFRHTSYIESVADKTFCGDGKDSYLKAVDYFSGHTVAV